MDILSHTLTGVAVSTTLLPFSKSTLKGNGAIIFMGGIGALLPDFDVISLWSKFDGTIGKLFNLSTSGKDIYSSKLWYSHHGFLHSIFAGLLLTFIIALLISLKKRKINYRILFNSRQKIVMLSAFFIGFIFHLLEDMPTPASVWGGVRFFWPSLTYVGGTGQIWWWNNYDIFLIIFSVIIINSVVIIFLKRRKKAFVYLPALMFSMGLFLSINQIKSRSFDFGYTGYSSNYSEFELRSKEIQREILGVRLFKLMNGFDNKIPINF